MGGFGFDLLPASTRLRRRQLQSGLRRASVCEQLPQMIVSQEPSTQ